MADSSGLKIVGAAFGDPCGKKTFSGLSFHLLETLRTKGCLCGTLSTRDLRAWDALTGCVDFGSIGKPGRSRLSRRWLWSPSTVATLSKRFDRRLRAFPGATALLQVGTHVYTLRPNPVHFCITDLTVAQAAAAGRFSIDSLSNEELRNALLVQRRIFDSCSGIFVLSEWARQSVINDMAQDPEKVLAVGAGANMDPIEPAPDKYSSGKILFVGYEWENKGGPLLMEAFEMVSRKLPDATLFIVGCKPGISHPKVKVVGPLSKGVPAEAALLRSLYQEATCFCLLSEFDAFPNVLLEAQYTGTPVVALDRQSRREAVLPDETGILVSEARPEAVAEALTRILACPRTAETMGQRARTFVRDRFTWDVVVSRMTDYMARVMAR